MAISTLTWHRVSDDEWQAGGLGSHYSIIEECHPNNPDGQVIQHIVSFVSADPERKESLGSSYDFAMARSIAQGHHLNNK